MPTVLAATLKPVVPFPEPDAPLLIVNHEALLVAVQAHPLPAVIPTDEVAAPLPTDVDVALSEYVHEPETAWRKFATVGAVLFSARDVFCEAVPVGMPL